MESLGDGMEGEVRREKSNWKPVGVFGAGLLVVGGLLWPFVAPGLRRHTLPYIPATDAQIRDVLSLSRSALSTLTRSAATQRPRVVDLGSGDGRVVLSAVRSLDVDGHGFELNRWLVLYSNIRAFRLGLFRKCRFWTRDMWKVNLTNYDVVILFLGSEMMKEIEEKLDQELRSSAAVVTTRFGLPNWKAKERKGLATLYLASDQKATTSSKTTD